MNLETLFTNFEYITLFRISTKETFFYERFISIKNSDSKKLKKMVLKVSPFIYMIYITVRSRLTLSTLFSQLLRFRVVLSRWTFHKKMFLLLRHEKNVLYSKLMKIASSKTWSWMMLFSQLLTQKWIW